MMIDMPELFMAGSFCARSLMTLDFKMPYTTCISANSSFSLTSFFSWVY
jgi:hypothetical protein